MLADRVIERGWVAVADGRIAEIGEGDAPERGHDLGGDLLIPAWSSCTPIISRRILPRPKVHWDPVAAVVSYDAQIATSGITTVLNSLRVWREEGAEEVDGQAGTLSPTRSRRARDAGLLRIEHFLHLRCEVPMPSVVEDAAELIGRPDVRLMSLMDHTPGQRQFRDPGEAAGILSRQEAAA